MLAGHGELEEVRLHRRRRSRGWVCADVADGNAAPVLGDVRGEQEELKQKCNQACFTATENKSI